MNKKPMNGAVCLLAAIAIAVCTAAGAPPPVATPEPQTELRATLSSLTDHIVGKKILDATQIEAHKRIIDTHRDIFGSNAAIIKAACDLVAAYDKVNGPLWVAHKGFIRTKVNRTLVPPATDIHWTIFTVMQAIMDRVYTADNVARHAALLNGFKFGSSAYFPGAVEPPTNSTATYMVKINASCPKPFTHVVMQEDIPARRPTGAYLAPGSIATVTVPPSIVGKGYTIRVGTHSWDFAKKPKVVRLDRSSLVYPIDSTNVNVASPLGGGIYIEVPLRANAAGIIDVAIRNAVRSPYFSAKPFHQTSLEEWKSVERNCKAPWADFQTEKFMMQVPSGWIRTLDDPATLMKNWDLAMDAMNDLMGLPHTWGKETMYCQVDLLIRTVAYAPGYPTLNDGYDPKKDYDSYTNHYLVRGPHCVPSHVFHEAGHGYFFVKFAEEAESTVNLLHVAVCNRQFGYSLDEAFADSRGKSKYRTLDSTAIEWMTGFNFIDKKPMEREEKAYQHKGHAKYVDTARLFGWNVLGDYWHSWVADEEQGKTVSRHETDIDVLNLRLSQSAGVDLTPLLHFWGTPPRDATALKKVVAAAKLPPSPKIYDTLTHYAALVPPDNKAFRDFALKLWNRMPSTNGYTTERGHARQWNEYDEKTAARITNVVQEIIATYFPDGRPVKLGNAGVGRAEEDTSRRPNVVFLLADQWRASATGYAGDPNVKTPNLDKLAKESINFETAVSVCPLCTPYRASLLTGRFPTTTGMITCDIPLADKELCMAEIFKTAGYETAYIGKWHLNGYGGRTAYIPPERRQGFDYWKAAECDHNYLKSHYYSGNSPEMKYWEGYDAFAQTTDANQYIRDHAKGDKPFLLAVSYGTPHFPHHTAPEEFVNMYPVEKLKLPPNVSENMREAVLKELPGYYGHCSALDRCVGEVVQTLREAGIADNTILVFTSDHGDMTGTHDVRPKLKQYPWDESIRVPFLLRYPAVHGKSPKSVKMPINTPDILPTLLGLSEINPPATMEGEDLSAAIKPGAPEHDRAALIMNVWPNIDIQRLKEYRAIRTSRHTYVLRLDGPWLMYDNQTDPWQMNNLVNKPEHAELQKQLDTQLKAGLKEIGDDFHPSKYYLDKWGYKKEGSSLSFGKQK